MYTGINSASLHDSRGEVVGSGLTVLPSSLRNSCSSLLACIPKNTLASSTLISSLSSVAATSLARLFILSVSAVERGGSNCTLPSLVPLNWIFIASGTSPIVAARTSIGERSCLCRLIMEMGLPSS